VVLQRASERRGKHTVVFGKASALENKPDFISSCIWGKAEKCQSNHIQIIGSTNKSYIKKKHPQCIIVSLCFSHFSDWPIHCKKKNTVGLT